MKKVKKRPVRKLASKKNKPSIIEIKSEPSENLPAISKNLPGTTFQSADLVIAKMLESKVDPDKLEKLLEVKGKYEAKENKKLFQIKFSEFQSELPVIKKTKEVHTRDGKLAYKYAPLEKIIEQLKSLMNKYQFSYRFSEGLIEKGNMKRINCHLMGYGHEEISYCDIPIPAGNKLINDAQLAGAASTYGKRYSFTAVTGVMADDDNDGQGLKKDPPPPAKMSRAEEGKAHADALTKVNLKYKEFCKMAKPNDKMSTYMSQIQTESLKNIETFILRLEQLIQKYSKTEDKGEL